MGAGRVRGWALGGALLVVMGSVSIGGSAGAAEGCGPERGAAARLLGADTAESLFGVDGTGVRVGIISDSFAARGQDAVDADVAAGWLPGPGNPCGYSSPVTVLNDLAEGGDDEGRAMAQAVHQVAPGAEIVFAASGESFVDAVDGLVDKGVSVIVDDVAIAGERQFHADAGAQAIRSAVDAGVFYVTAAGNYGVAGAAGTASEGYPIGAWSTEAYRPMACPDPVAELYPGEIVDCLDFDPGAGEDATMTVTLPPRSLMVGALDWAERDGAVTTAFDYVLEVDGTINRSSASNPQRASAQAEIGNTFSAADIDNVVSIVRHVTPEASTPPIAVTWTQVPGFGVLVDQEYFVSTETDTVGATLFGHQASPAAFPVGAMNAEDSMLETYSTLGPARLYFGVPEPVTVAGPAVVGVDNLPVSATVLGGSGWFRGTSAAAPTIAASAALIRQYSPALTPDQLRAALTDHAVTGPVGRPWNTSVPDARSQGAGLVDVEATLRALTPAPTPPPTPVPTPSPSPAPAPTGPALPPPTTAAAPELAATGSATTPRLPLALAVLAVAGGILVLTRSDRTRGGRVGPGGAP